MKKNFLQDVVPSNHKRSIRDIPLPKHKKEIQDTLYQAPSSALTKKETSYNEVEVEVSHNRDWSDIKPAQTKKVFTDEVLHDETHMDSHESSEKVFSNRMVEKLTPVKNKKSATKKIFTAFVIVVCITTFFLIFGRNQAVITLYAKKDTYTVSNNIALNSSNPLVANTQITKSVSRTVPATEEQQIEQQAQGRIRIINTHKETSQELVKNTRFQAPNGLIYRIRESVVIPGYTKSGDSIVPGTLEVQVYADSAGEEYNISNTKFTIPGFSGMEQFEKITAETVGDLSGGYIGIRKVISTETKQKLEEEIKQELTSEIQKISKNSTEYILIPNLSSLSFADTKDEANGSSVTLTISATANAYSVVKQDLFNFIGQNTVPNAQSTDTFTLNPDELSFVLSEDSIQITGQTTIAWIIDVNKLKQDFAGKKRAEITPIIDTYNSFERFNVDISPVWARKFPNDISKIEVKILE
jgi:hypothetical protein